MAKSFFNVLLSNAGATVGKIVIAQPDSKTALQNAIDAAITAVSPTATVINAIEVGGKAADGQIPVAVSPTTDGPAKSLFSVQFRSGSGTGGTTPPSMTVISNSQTTSGVTTSDIDLAIQYAAANGGGVPNTVNTLATADIDATS